jgi:hypothetical protein
MDPNVRTPRGCRRGSRPGERGAFQERAGPQERCVGLRVLRDLHSVGLVRREFPPACGPRDAARVRAASAHCDRRSLRTFDLFLTRLLDRTGNMLPDYFVVTLPTSPRRNRSRPWSPPVKPSNRRNRQQQMTPRHRGAVADPADCRMSLERRGVVPLGSPGVTGWRWLPTLAALCLPALRTRGRVVPGTRFVGLLGAAGFVARERPFLHR